MPLSTRVASQPHLRIALDTGCLIGVTLVVATLATGHASSPAPQAAPPAAVVPVAMPASLPMAPAVLPQPPVAPPAPAPDVHTNQLMFVFQAGGATYMKLADLKTPGEDGDDLPVPRHGKLQLSHDNYIDAAVGPVADRHVPRAHQGWKDRKVKVDNRCEASVVGFAVVSRVVGDPGYADLDQWNAAGVMKVGHAVLAAKLDRCTGSFARDAALPDIIVPAHLDDPALERAARAALIASAPAPATQREWDERTTAAGGKTVPWHDEATFTAEVLRHPRTGAIFVSVHGHVSSGCGDPHANVWGLFRIDAGKLVPVQLRQLGEIETIDALIDVDGDGELEILGKPWLGYDTLLTRANGEALEGLSVPFVGCPC